MRTERIEQRSAAAEAKPLVRIRRIRRFGPSAHQPTSCFGSSMARDPSLEGAGGLEAVRSHLDHS